MRDWEMDLMADGSARQRLDRIEDKVDSLQTSVAQIQATLAGLRCVEHSDDIQELKANLGNHIELNGEARLEAAREEGARVERAAAEQKAKDGGLFSGVTVKRVVALGVLVGAASLGFGFAVAIVVSPAAVASFVNLLK